LQTCRVDLLDGVRWTVHYERIDGANCPVAAFIFFIQDFIHARVIAISTN